MQLSYRDPLFYAYKIFSHFSHHQFQFIEENQGRPKVMVPMNYSNFGINYCHAQLNSRYPVTLILGMIQAKSRENKFYYEFFVQSKRKCIEHVVNLRFSFAKVILKSIGIVSYQNLSQRI